ncbi:MAG: twin-arginine translocase subunit TatC [Limisphaerales bacterium]
MPDEPPPSPDLPDEEEEGGGPVKPFLEHLEDLRWTLLKVLSSIVIAMIVCLVAGNKLVALLTYPLVKAQKLTDSANRSAAVRLGSSIIGKIPLSSLDTNLWGDKPPTAFEVTFQPEGERLFFVLRPDTNAVAGDAGGGGAMVLLKNYSPIGGFAVALEMALYGGFALASPFVMFFIGQFVIPALKTREKQFLYRALAVGVGLFLLGVVFCYFAIMQVTLLAAAQFSQWLGFSADEWRAEDYIDFVVKMMLAVGLSFQLPVVLLTLVKVGILSYKALSNSRSYFVVINLIACAFITPSGDPITLLFLAIPVQFLYEISVFIAWVWWRRDEREAAALEGPPS